MKERPILMSGPMVRACLRDVDPKTQTRRALVRQSPKWCDSYAQAPLDKQWWIPSGVFLSDPSGVLGRGKLAVRQNGCPIRCPYGVPGDRLWVRETFSDDWADVDGVYYRADGGMPIEMSDAGVKWSPSIFMPRKLSRLTLEVVNVRVERLQAISEADAIAEGAPVAFRPGVGPGRHAYGFAELWDEINGLGAWKQNPWVWVVEFKRIEQERKAA